MPKKKATAISPSAPVSLSMYTKHLREMKARMDALELRLQDLEEDVIARIPVGGLKQELVSANVEEIGKKLAAIGTNPQDETQAFPGEEDKEQ